MPDQIGRRPSRPGFLLVVGVLWIVSGVAALIGLRAGWRIIAGVFFIGVGLFYLRAAAATVSRRDDRP